MSMKNCCTTNEENEENATVNVKVDVTRIVKYVCFTAIIVVGIIFGSKYCYKILKEGYFKEKLCKK